MKYRGILLLWLLTSTTDLPAQPSPVDSLAQALRIALAARGKAFPLPPVQLDSSLGAHARFARDTIWIGPPQPDFPQPGDRLSLLYHEYCHARWQAQGRFAIGTDSLGRILQWETDQWMTYRPSAAQVAREMARYDHRHPDADPRLRAAFRETISRPVRQPFRYAPSNLAREEMAAYRAQRAGARQGLYSLSPAARRAIAIRLDQLAHTYRQRRAYERQHRLRRDGTPRP